MSTDRSHVIRCTSGDRVPNRFTLIAADIDSLPLTDDGLIARLAPSCIGIMSLRVTNGRVTREVTRRAYSLDGFWDCMDSLTGAKSHCVVLCNGALKLWTALDLWGQIARGRYTLTGSDQLGGADARGKKRRRWKGFACLENPPFIVLLRDTQTGATMRLVDVRNWNQPPPGKGKSTTTQLEDMAVWLLDWLDTIKQLKLGSFQNTTAAQAYYGWRRSYYDAAVVVHDDERAHLLERAAYFGGRNECYQLGVVSSRRPGGPTPGHYGYSVPCLAISSPVMRLDLNSCYTAMAADNDVPVQLSHYVPHPTPEREMGRSMLSAMIADVTVETDAPCVPYSPVVEVMLTLGITREEAMRRFPRISTAIVYPVGVFRTALCGPEIRLALESGAIIHRHATAYYRMAPALKRWAEKLWEERMRAKSLGRDAVSATLKALPVCLFGRLGQQRMNWVDQPKGKSEQPYSAWYKLNDDTQELERWRCVGWTVQRMERGGETGQSVPMVPAWINSLARARLWDLLRVAGPLNTYYVDTDSLWTNLDGWNNLMVCGHIDPAALGKLKLEAEYHEVEFIGQKHYVCDGTLTCAAMPQHAQSDGMGTYWFASIEGFPHALPMRRPPEPIERTLIRRAPMGYNAGLVGLNGRVLPLTVGRVSVPMKD